MSRALLAVNAGSSSLKFAVHAAAPGLQRLARGEVEGLGSTDVRFTASRDGQVLRSTVLAPRSCGRAGVDAMLQFLGDAFQGTQWIAVGHRIAHGGPKYAAPLVLDAAIVDELETLDPLAPQHQPINLATVRRLQDAMPGALAIGCFDTAFHAGWGDAARRLPLPRRFHDAGVRRYGFHGLSYEYLNGRMSVLAPAASRVVMAHLGSGASICAVRDGRSIDATMGFSAVDGLPMATRSGSIDPGAIFHLHRAHGLGYDEIEHLLYRESGLAGMSGLSGDMRLLLASDQEPARQAVDVFVRRVAGAIGEMTTLLGGLDAVVFSGGIGARAAAIRERVCAHLGYLGVRLDAARNAVDAERLAAEGAAVPAFCVRTDEEQVIAAHAMAAWLRACGAHALG